jgi:RNA polymerase sigma factor (TIGR02999 family)
LKAGRSDAKESDPIAPVADEHVAPVLPFARLQDRLRVEWAAGTSKVVDRQPGEPVNEVTRILSAAGQGDRDAASKLLPLVYDELRKLAAQRLAHEQPNQTLQATALVHEAYLRLVDADQIPHFDGRGHFFAAAAEAMRRILIENARHKQSLKAGGGRLRLDLDDVDPAIEAPAPTRGLDLLALDEALTKLERDDKIKAELVKLRYFGGLTLEEAGLVLRLSPATADRYWAFARAWLYRELSAGAP